MPSLCLANDLDQSPFRPIAKLRSCNCSVTRLRNPKDTKHWRHPPTIQCKNCSPCKNRSGHPTSVEKSHEVENVVTRRCENAPRFAQCAWCGSAQMLAPGPPSHQRKSDDLGVSDRGTSFVDQAGSLWVVTLRTNGRYAWGSTGHVALQRCSTIWSQRCDEASCVAERGVVRGLDEERDRDRLAEAMSFCTTASGPELRPLRGRKRTLQPNARLPA